jgi:GntR family transcriptional regulator
VDEADLLEIAPGTALLVERRTILDQRGAPVEFTESRYVGERYRFEVELLRQPT